jgi:hypothetical protein
MGTYRPIHRTAQPVSRGKRGRQVYEINSDWKIGF